MDTEKMKQDLGGGNVFEIGEPNTAFAQYFIGQSYLKMLTTERVGVGNVTAVTTGTSTTRAVRSCSSQADAAIIRSGARRRRS